MENTPKTLFYINRQKTKVDDNTAILCRATIDGKSTVITTGKEYRPSEWNTRQGLTTNKETNQRINKFRELVEKTYRGVLTRNGVVSVELIKNRLRGITASSTMLFAMNRVEPQAVKESVGRSRAEGTYLNLFYSDRNLREFVENKRVRDISIETTTGGLFERYRLLLKKRGLRASTVDSNLRWLGRLMFHTVDKRTIRCDPFGNAKLERGEKKMHFLQRGGVMRPMVIKMNGKEAELVRLMFVFSCLTGLAIPDMENLEYGHIQTAADGQVYIRKERQKTKVEFIIPLHSTVETTISHCQKEPEGSEVRRTVKERGDHLVFHRDCSRSIMGIKLSIVGKACDICQRLPYHMTRHTFGTMSLSTGIPIKSIARVMGHASISSIQIYAQVTDKKISKDMDRLTAKQSVKEKETLERGACKSSDIVTCKTEGSA